MWSGTEESHLILESAARLARGSFGGAEAPDASAIGRLERAVAVAAEQGFLVAPLSEGEGGTNLSLAGQCMLVTELAKESAAFGVLLATHFSALGALAEAGDGSVRACEEPPLVGLAIADPYDPRDHLCPIGPARCGRLVVLGFASARVLAGHDAASACTAVPELSGLEGLAPARLRVRTLAGLSTLDAESARRAWSRWKLLLAAAQVGNAGAACALAVAYAKQRRQTGRPIIDHQNVRAMLASMITRVNAAESFVMRAADDPERFRGPFDLCTQAYQFAGTAAEQVCLDAVQVLGGYGYMKDYGAERRLRACKSLQAAAGDHLKDVGAA